MAGIGLRLRRAAISGTYLEAAAAYLSSAVIASGPWLTAVIALSILGSAATTILSYDGRMLLFATITYAFGCSLIVSGGLQMVLTRYLADQLYAGETSIMSPTCSGILLLALPLWILATPFLVWAPFTLVYRLVAAMLFVVLTLIWLVATFLSAARDYLRVVIIFVLSYGASVAGALIVGPHYGVLGCLCGFSAGQVLCLALLLTRIFREFPPVAGLSLDVAGAIGRYWQLGVIGLLYMVGVWADNVVYWFSPSGITIGGFFRISPTYDGLKLIAFLATIPASAVFLVHLETRFYEHYRSFFERIREKGTYAQIAAASDAMRDAMRSGLTVIAILQAVVDTVLFLLAPALFRWLGVSATVLPLLHTVILAVGAQFVLLAVLILLLYLDERDPALLAVVVFAAGNVGASLLTRQLGPNTYGAGYLAASSLAALVGLVYLVARMRHFTYRTFMLQPMQS
jgi:polysaccharide biosynthesis protein PelG